MKNREWKELLKDKLPSDMTLALVLTPTYRVSRASKRGPPLRFHPENVKGRPLFPKDGWSRLCSPT